MLDRNKVYFYLSQNRFFIFQIPVCLITSLSTILSKRSRFEDIIIVATKKGLHFETGFYTLAFTPAFTPVPSSAELYRVLAEGEAAEQVYSERRGRDQIQVVAGGVFFRLHQHAHVHYLCEHHTTHDARS